MSDYSDIQPIDRSRAYTWDGGICISDSSLPAGMMTSIESPSSKKPWSRRNAWGSLSYADLISRAIESTTDKRMTLAQIYEWMVQNIAYFRDKGNANSSAGWKNSIRHNLSLHRRFKRVPNDDPGKSSWWMLNEANNIGPVSRKRTFSIVEKRDAGLTSPSISSTHATKFPDQRDRFLTMTSSPTSASCFDTLTPAWSPTGQTCVLAGTIPNLDHDGEHTNNVIQLKPLQWHQPSLLEKVVQNAGGSPLAGWHQPSGAGNVKQFQEVAMFDDVYGQTSLSSSNCTPLAPISELLSPPPTTQFFSYETLSSPELPPAPMYPGIQSLPEIADIQNATSINSAAFNERVFLLTSGAPQNATGNSLPSALQSPVTSASSAQWSSPGYSMLRQMLSQSHRQNALMHGVAQIDGRTSKPENSPGVQLVINYDSTTQTFSMSAAEKDPTPVTAQNPNAAPCGTTDDAELFSTCMENPNGISVVGHPLLDLHENVKVEMKGDNGFSDVFDPKRQEEDIILEDVAAMQAEAEESLSNSYGDVSPWILGCDASLVGMETAAPVATEAPVVAKDSLSTLENNNQVEPEGVSCNAILE